MCEATTFKGEGEGRACLTNSKPKPKVRYETTNNKKKKVNEEYKGSCDYIAVRSRALAFPTHQPVNRSARIPYQMSTRRHRPTFDSTSPNTQSIDHTQRERHSHQRANFEPGL